MSKQCYKCGGQILDDYPSHLCAICRKAITDPTPPEKQFENSLTEYDRRLLRGMKVGV
jgi:hypothetical protein